jgi:uncharacterized membrane protein
MSGSFGFLVDNWRYVADLGTFALCALMVAIYQWRLARRVRRNPDVTVQGMNAAARAAWVRRVTEDRDLHTMAVQTFRNSTMAASLMASTAVLLIFGILNFSTSVDKVAAFGRGISTWGSHEPGMWVFKLMVLIVDFFVAFFAFALAIRGYHHAGFLLNVPLDPKHGGVSVQKITNMLHRTARYYSIGMRTYYLAVPLLLWLFGPIWMLIATVALLVVLNHLDHLPD